MISKSVMCGALFSLAILASMGSAAHAEIIMSGSICHHLYNSEAQYISYTPRRVFNTDVNSRSILCSLPRTAIPTGGNIPAFRINGSNDDGTTTTCTVDVRDYNGNVRAVFTFPNPNAGPWSKLVAFAPDLVSSSDSVSMFCRLPPNAGGGIHRISTF